MSKRHRGIGIEIIAAGVMASVAQPAGAQSSGTQVPSEAASDQPEDSGITEIIVTAQRRSESIQDIGISISAIGGEQLRALGYTSSTDMVNMVPGVSLSNTSGGQFVQFAIRGVTQADFADHTELQTPSTSMMSILRQRRRKASACSIWIASRSCEAHRGRCLAATPRAGWSTTSPTIQPRNWTLRRCQLWPVQPCSRGKRHWRPAGWEFFRKSGVSRRVPRPIH